MLALCVLVTDVMLLDYRNALSACGTTWATFDCPPSCFGMQCSPCACFPQILLL